MIHPANEARRMFVSIALPKGIKDYLKHLQQPAIRWIKWQKPENFHITLIFLGYLEEPEIETSNEILAKTAPLFAPFTLKLARLKAERDMLWLLLEESEMLLNLRAELKNQFAGARLGKRERREYYPHILLARSKTGRKMTWEPENFLPQEFTADRLGLYESQLHPKGAIHTLIQSFALEKPPSPSRGEGRVSRKIYEN